MAAAVASPDVFSHGSVGRSKRGWDVECKKRAQMICGVAKKKRGRRKKERKVDAWLRKE